MDVPIVGGRKYVEIPGQRNYELPPLLIRSSVPTASAEERFNEAAAIAEEDILPIYDVADEDSPLHRHKLDLAVNLVDRYTEIVRDWGWGDSILEWVRQCQITFENQVALRPLLSPDVWPHAGHSSFVTLLSDKRVLPVNTVGIQSAVGLRLAFRQPPPISCFSDQFLFYLYGSTAVQVYQNWAELASDEPASLPPERFGLQVIQTKV